MKSDDPRLMIQQAMRAAFPSAEARVDQFYAMQEYQLGWRDEWLQPANVDPGKLLRPRLALMACQAIGGDPQRALPLAAAIQLVHDFSLIHDDIEDNSDTRRGRPTVWKLWGLAQGINTGDGMLIVAHLALHGLATQGVSAEQIVHVFQRFDQTILQVCEGQFLDLSFEGNLEISEPDYLAMIQRKTAVLVAAATELGSYVGGADQATCEAMYRFGLNLGLAFQIEDDILGIWGNPADTGKPYAADLYRRKLSLPVIHALRTAANRHELATMYHTAPSEADDVAPMLAILDAAGSREYTAHLAASYTQATLAALDDIQGETAALAELRATTMALLGRKK